MDNITLGQIVICLSFLGTVIGSIEFLAIRFKKQIEKILKPINDDIKSLDVSQCKNFLVRFLADVEQENDIDEVERQRAYEIYDHYTNDLKQNSYIHDKWDKLMR